MRPLFDRLRTLLLYIPESEEPYVASIRQGTSGKTEKRKKTEGAERRRPIALLLQLYTALLHPHIKAVYIYLNFHRVSRNSFSACFTIVNQYNIIPHLPRIHQPGSCS